MKELSLFLNKFKSVFLRETEKRIFISEIIKKIIGYDVGIKDIEIKDGIVKIKSSSILKNQIFIKKIKLISEISKKFNIVDIQ